MLSIRVAGLERAEEQVGLAEHAVQVQVEAGQPVARAEAEARREDAGVALGVDRDEVRRVRLGPGCAVERGDERRGRALRAAGRAGAAGGRAWGRRRRARCA